MKTVCRFFLVAMMCGGGDFALAKTGSELLDLCQNAERAAKDLNTVEQQRDAMCAGFIVGAIDGYNNAITDSLGKLPSATTTADMIELIKLQMCIPQGVTVGQFQRIVLHFLRDHPEKLHGDAASLAIEAVRTPFPCGTVKKN
jgi:hypothetical protein